MLRENEYNASSGIPTLLFLIVAALADAAFIGYELKHAMPLGFGAGAIVLIVIFTCFGGFFVVNPGEAKALQLFGEYKGTVRKQGFWFANPFLTKKTISLRIRNFETAKLKVNDHGSNPIEIGAIVAVGVIGVLRRQRAHG